MKLECVLVVLLLIAGTLAAGLQPERVSRTGFTMEIRSEPIPGVPLTGAKIQPLPVTFRTMSGCQVRPLATFEQEMPCEHSGVVRTEAAVVAGFSAGMSGDGLPNLVFYTPSGWDYPIVPSNVRNTHTVGPDLNDSDTTFFDFAVANNGSSTARPRFYTYLYRNGVPFAGFYTESLPPGYYTYYNDYPTMIPAGTHLIAGFTDSTNVIAESLENDNRWSRNFTWRATGQARPNLKPWTPSGWDYPIVPSNVRNTHTVGPDLNDYDTTFIDLAFINDGNATAQPRFYTYLYLDGRVISGWYIDSLPPGWYGYAEDDPNFVPAGQHTLAMFVDSTDVVSESNEADNRFSNSWTWRHDPATLPNLTYYVPDTSWDYPIVPSNVRGTHRVGPNLNDQDTTFIDWCIANLGNAWARPEFYVYFYFDAIPFAGWVIDSMPPMSYGYVEDDPNLFPSGNHLLGMVIDSTGTVTESNENDNRWARLFYWAPSPKPNLTYYQPPGWDYPIVPSNVRNTHTVGPDLNEIETTFVDVSIANTGSVLAQPRFYTYVYSDGVPFFGFYLDSLPAHYYVYVEDYPRMFSAGDHELALFVDSTNVVVESLESDNRWAHTFTWRPGVAVEESGVRAELPALFLGANPVQGPTVVRYRMPQAGPVRLAVYDRMGRRAAVLVQGLQQAGEHRVVLAGDKLAAGVHFLVLETGKGTRQVRAFVKL